MEFLPGRGVQDPNQGDTRRKRKIDHFKIFLLPLDELQPFLHPRMLDQLPEVDVGIVQEDIGILMRLLQNLDEIVLDVLIGMAAVDEGQIYGRQVEVLDRRGKTRRSASYNASRYSPPRSAENVR